MQLRVEGFACFKKEQWIKFDGLELFAISGVTGAGKSTLLDAIVYALYGRVPRVGKRGYTEFISLGKTRMSVCFDFKLGDQRYRITRTARRQGTPTAQIEEVTEKGETIRPLADGVSGVDKVVPRLVGLDYDGFIQAVVLPQGEFARFLKSGPGERTKLLRELLRLGRYEEMRKSAQARSNSAAEEAAHIQDRLTQDYGGATPAEVEKLAAQIAQQTTTLKHLRAQLADADAATRSARRLRERSAELTAKRAEHALLTSKKEEISEKERRIDAGRRAASVAPLLEQLVREEARAKGALQELHDAEAVAQKAAESERRAREKAARAESEARRVTDLEKKIHQLGEVIGLMEPRGRAEKDVRNLEQDQRETKERLDDLECRRRQHVRDRQKAEEKVAVAECELQDIGYDPKLHEKVDGIFEDASAAIALRRSLTEQREAAEEASREAEAAKKEAERTAKRAMSSARSLEKAVHASEAAALRLREAEREHTAECLRGELRAGEPCPVCDQPVRVVPKARRAASHLEDLRTAAGEAETLVRELREKDATLQAEARNLAKAATAAESKAGKAAKAVEAKVAEYTGAAQRLTSWGRKNSIELGDSPEDHVLRLERQLKAKRKKHEQVAETHRSALKNRQEVEHSLEKLASQETALQDKLDRLTRQLAEAQELLNGYVARIKDAAGEDDPRELRDTLQNERAELEGARDATRRAAEQASVKLSEAKTRAAEAKERSAKAETEVDAARTKSAKALCAAGFTSASSARAAALSESELRRLDRDVREFAEKVSALDARIQELDKELGGKLTSQEELDAREAELRDATSRVETTAAELRAAQEQLQQLRERVVKAQELTSRLEARREVAQIFGALADELQSNRFQQYLLEETVEGLVAGASQRLKKLSDRYALVLRDGDFSVVDHDNAGEQRSADTLSGGETFLTSLALALELSAQVQRAAGALHLDSIFIDEGFGTLDPDTLETAAAAIEALPVGGRMVGIITHLADLTERLPGRIMIDRGADGSQVRVAVP